MYSYEAVRLYSDETSCVYILIEKREFIFILSSSVFIFKWSSSVFIFL